MGGAKSLHSRKKKILVVLRVLWGGEKKKEGGTMDPGQLKWELRKNLGLKEWGLTIAKRERGEVGRHSNRPGLQLSGIKGGGTRRLQLTIDQALCHKGCQGNGMETDEWAAWKELKTSRKGGKQGGP